MNVGKSIKLENGNEHDLAFGDVLEFNFKPLMDSPFSNSNFGQHLREVDPDKLIFFITKNNFGLFGASIDYIKDEKVIDTFEFEDPTFFNYLCHKNMFSFLRTEEREWTKKSDIKVEFGDVFLSSFAEVEKNKYIKADYLEILKEKNPEHVVVHFFNMKDIAPHHVNSLAAKVYAFTKKEFVNFDTEEDYKREMEYYKIEKPNEIYQPDKFIVEYTFSGVSSSHVNMFSEKGMLNNKVANINKPELDFYNVKSLIRPKNKKNIKP